MKRKEYYKIGEISTLYGIGADSLRYYEEIGILKPRRDSNGYRMYSIHDIRTLNILRELRSIGFSMAEIKEHLADFDLTKTLSLFRREIDAIDQKQAELAHLRQQLSSRVDEIHQHLAEIGSETPLVQHLPARRVLSLTENIYMDTDLDFIIKKLQKEYEDQLYIIGNGSIGATIPLDHVQSGHYGHFNSVFCIINGDNYDSLLPEGDYLCQTVRGGYDKMPAAWNALFAYLNTQGLTAAADPMERYIIDNHDTNDPSEYITQLMIPLETPHKSAV